MNKNFFITILIIISTLLISHCSIDSGAENIIISQDSLIIYNYDFNPSLSSIIILNDSFNIVNPDSNKSDLIITSYLTNSIVFLSPSKDTTRFFNNTITGIMDVGEYLYTYPPDEGYYDLEYLNKEHYYFIMFDDSTFARLYLYDYNEDSLICKLEYLIEGESFSQ